MNDSTPTAPGDGDPRRLLTVRSWFLVAVLLMGTLAIASAVVVQILLGRTAEASDRIVDRLSPARVEAGRLQSALLSQETGVRGYALTGDRRFLEPYNAGLAEERRSLEALRGLLAGEPALRDDLTGLERAIGTWRRDHAAAVLAQVAERGPGRSAAETAARGRPAFDEIHRLTEAQERHLAEAREEGRAELHDIRTQRGWVLAAMFAAFLMTMVLLVLLLHHTVGRPLGMLRTETRRVADGEFGHVITPHGPADVQDVARGVEAMRRRIVRELEEATERELLLRRRTAELDEQTAELRRSNAELEQFAYVASHDLQEPLRKVASFCQMLERRYADQLDDRARQYIDFAVDGAKRMQVLINDLLTFSRVGRMDHHRGPLALREPLDRALDNLGDALTSAEASVEVPDDLPELTGDPTQLTMLWQNLIGNAVKFRSPDRPPVVRITCEAADGHWHLTVTDNGIGVPAEYAEKIFVIFQRLHGRDAYGGTGIGLALCKKIVEFHGGRIWLDEEHDEGTRFHFTLAADPEPEPEPEAGPEGEAGPDPEADPDPDPEAGAAGESADSADLQGARS
ncbi:sensor histidine kinase [Spirillospora albida]|uniref:sensor histidine kinase n=1 Tax=Spirillospora albida TaxID=58123 RepID=UPI0009FBE4AB|nr:sensor histidine kinase [Spirillospora albida]